MLISRLKIKFILLIILFFKVSSCHQSQERPLPIINNILTLKTVYGNLKFNLLDDKAPSTVKRFKELVQTGFYEGITFHRIIPNSILQTGDPTNLGSGGSGSFIRDEINNLKHIKGSLVMAKKPNVNDSADSQFYIALKELPELDIKYTVFGNIISGIEYLELIKLNDKIISISLSNK